MHRRNVRLRLLESDSINSAVWNNVIDVRMA
jgi:hypothetical protein